jgi:hypothetical protein
MKEVHQPIAVQAAYSLHHLALATPYSFNPRAIGQLRETRDIPRERGKVEQRKFPHTGSKVQKHRRILAHNNHVRVAGLIEINLTRDNIGLYTLTLLNKCRTTQTIMRRYKRPFISIF